MDEVKDDGAIVADETETEEKKEEGAEEAETETPAEEVAA